MENGSTSLTKSELEEFCDHMDRNADAMMDPAVAGSFQQTMINATCASGMREVTNSLRDLAGIDRP